MILNKIIDGEGSGLNFSREKQTSKPKRIPAFSVEIQTKLFRLKICFDLRFTSIY